nr:gastrula zinc finger protein XlCGF7.1 [Parasteatoda tepidariorum]
MKSHQCIVSFKGVSGTRCGSFKEVAGYGKFKCNLCSYSTNVKTNWKNHQLTHTGLRPFTCETCAIRFDNSLARRGSVDIVTRREIFQPKFKCHLCSYSTNIKTNLKNHELTHSGLRPFTCTTCALKFGDYSMVKHGSFKVVTSYDLDAKFKCNLCQYCTNIKTNLKNHQLTHSGLRPFACTTCVTRWVESNLRRSRRFHMPETEDQLHKRHRCKFCPYSTDVSTHLTDHELIHIGVRPYSCSICGRGFTQKSNMKQHTLIHFRDNQKQTS